MELHKGCNYCKNLKSFNSLLRQFTCLQNEQVILENAGSCFVAIWNNSRMIISDCPDFEERVLNDL